MSANPDGVAAGKDPEAVPPDAHDPEATGTGGAAPAGAEAPGSRWRRARELLTGARSRAGAAVRRMPRSRLAWGMVLVSIVLATGWRRCGIRGCPNVATLASYQPGGASVLLDREGKVFADLGPVDHSVVEIESLPDYVPAAFVAVEDKRFFSHNGVDWRRVLGAAWANIKAGRAAQGSSTITMQLSRNLFPDRIRAADRTLRRKLLEVRVARDIERHFEKQEILELYLNHIYFGAGAYGIEAAARHYFGRAAEDLSIEQAALLAALPKAPASYDPRRHEDRARQRRDLVLALMADQGYVTAERAERAQASPLRVASSRGRRSPGPRAAYFVQVVRDQLEDRLGEELYSRPLRIHTTLDARAQSAAEEELEAQIRRVESGRYGTFRGPRLADFSPGDAQTAYLQGAVVIIDNATGDVLALVGGREARHSSFNRATAAHRQAGSAFKPFVYATALSRGFPPNLLLDDSPYRLIADDGKPWEPDNYDGEFLGPITFRDAFVFSRNVPTIRLADRVGENHIAKFARNAGIEADLRETPMIALGIAEVSPLELTAAYTAFSGQGIAVEPRFVLRVEDADGKVLWEPDARSRRVLDAGVAYLMTDLMRDAVDRGTGRAVRQAGYRGLASGKTGTTNEGADNWFVGYTPAVTAGVWVGFDQPHEIAPRASGSVAAYAWGRLLRRIGSWAGGSPWQPPQRVVQISIDPSTGLALSDGCVPRQGEAQTEYFLRGSTPDESCPEYVDRRGRRSIVDHVFGWIGGLFGGSDERDVRVESPDGRRERRIAPEPPDPWEEWPAPRPQSRAEQRRAAEWIESLEQMLDDAADRRRVREQQALDRLRGLAESLRDRADRNDRDQVDAWIDSALRSIEQAAREQRSTERRRQQQWLEGVVRELQRNGLSSAQRRALERELRRALSDWGGI